MTNAIVPVLDGPRIRLRAHRAGDRDAMFALYSDPQTTRYLSFAAWTELAQAEAYLAPLLEVTAVHPTAYRWAIVERSTNPADDVMIGTVTLFHLDREQGRAEVGYSLAPAHHGRGFAREAVALAISFGFATFALRRIEADVDPRNAPSWRLLERLGFVREGLLRERWYVNGELCDTALYGLLRREYAAP